MIRTLAPEVLNLLASPAETVKFKTVSLVSVAFKATALNIKNEDNRRKTSASFIAVEKDALFCKNIALRLWFSLPVLDLWLNSIKVSSNLNNSMRLELDDFYGPFQPKPFYDYMKKN